MGVVHRDLKPANVMVTPDGRVKVLDFGVAQRRLPRRDRSRRFDAHRGRCRSLTSGFVGTVPYASPEQLTGRAVDGRADMFSLGVMLYELVCGRRPFAGDNAAQILEAVAHRGDRRRFPDLPSDPRMPAFERLVRRMLARDPRTTTPSRPREVRASLTSARLRRAVDRRRRRYAHRRHRRLRQHLGKRRGRLARDGHHRNVDRRRGTARGAVDRAAGARRRDRLKTLGPANRGTGRPAVPARRAGAAGAVGRERRIPAIRRRRARDGVAHRRRQRTARADDARSTAASRRSSSCRIASSASSPSSLRAAISPASSLAPETEVVSAYEAFSRGLLNRRAESFESLDRAVTLFERAVDARSGVRARAHRARRRLQHEGRLPVDARAAPAGRRQPAARDRRCSRARRGPGASWARRWWLGQEDAEGMAAHPPRARDRSGRRRGTTGRWGARSSSASRGLARPPAGSIGRSSKNPNAGWYALQLAHCAALLRDFARGERGRRARRWGCRKRFSQAGKVCSSPAPTSAPAIWPRCRAGMPKRSSTSSREIDFLVRTEHALRQPDSRRAERAARAASYLRSATPAQAQRRVRRRARELRPPRPARRRRSVHALLRRCGPRAARRGGAGPRLPRARARRAAGVHRRARRDRARVQTLRGDVRFQRLMVRIAPSG